MRYGDRALAGLLFFLGSVEFLLGMLIAEASLPTYSIAKNYISDLGVGSTAVVFNTSIVVLGLLSLSGAYFYHRTHRTLWITLPFVLAGIGPIGVGLFNENTGVPHLVFALISFLFGGFAAILSSFRVRPPFRYLSILLGILGLAALVLFEAGQYAGIGACGMERLIAYPILLWETALGGYLMFTAEDEPAAATVPGSKA